MTWEEIEQAAVADRPKAAELRKGYGIPEPKQMEKDDAGSLPLTFTVAGGGIDTPTQIAGFLESGHRAYVKCHNFRGGGLDVVVLDRDAEEPNYMHYALAIPESEISIFHTYAACREFLAPYGVALPEIEDKTVFDQLDWHGS